MATSTLPGSSSSTATPSLPLFRFKPRRSLPPLPRRLLTGLPFSSIRIAGIDKDTARSYFVSAATSTEASAKVIDGKSISREIRFEIADEILRMKSRIGVVPGLAVILVGNRKYSATYARNKQKACEAVGIYSIEVHLPEETTEAELIGHICDLNTNSAVHGIIVQLPLPSHMDVRLVLNNIRIDKDVDGFNPLNIGQLCTPGVEPLFFPCTPKGCIELLHRCKIDIKGKQAVVIVRSSIFGLRAALLLQKEDATVTTIHSRTQNPELIARQADIIIAAVWKPNMVRGSWIKPGAVVIDVGINPVEDATSPQGYRLVGDVCYEEASKVAHAIAPVPGGVGPITMAMLLSNTLTSAKRMNNL